jgi:cellulose biosynthesis protein BcsQ
MTQPRDAAQVITFYSYKGGTGRSMALANVACILARDAAEAGGKGVLMIDWDLEAPGLHRFFRSLLHGRSGEGRAGLIELLWKLRDFAETVPEGSEEAPEGSEQRFRKEAGLAKYIVKTEIEHLDLIKAGRFDDDYPERVNTFRWDELYGRAAWLLPWFIRLVGKEYRYVLIDSRTGVTDVSGVCTMILPEILVAVFTPNRQSIEGARDLVRRALAFRGGSDDLRPLRVFPLPSRVEPARPSLQREWRSDESVGYQPAFEAVFRDALGLAQCDLTSYFDEIQIQHVPDYAYGEEIAALVEETGDRLSLARSYEAFARRLERPENPWDEARAAAPKRDPKETALALAAVLQSICLEFHVMAFVRRDRGKEMPREEGERAFGKGTILPPEQFRSVLGQAEWVVNDWVSSDVKPVWQMERDRLASIHLPGINFDTTIYGLIITVLDHIVNLLMAVSNAADAACEVTVYNGWPAWVRLKLLGAVELRADQAPGVSEKETLKLSGPLSSFNNLLQEISVRFDWQALESANPRGAGGPNEGVSRLLDVAEILGGVWSGLVKEHKVVFEKVMGVAAEEATPEQPSWRQYAALFDCDFERWVRQVVAPNWRAARDAMRLMEMDVAADADFLTFLQFWLATVSTLLHEGLRNLGNFEYLGGFAISKENWAIAQEQLSVPEGIRRSRRGIRRRCG